MNPRNSALKTALNVLLSFEGTQTLLAHECGLKPAHFRQIVCKNPSYFIKRKVGRFTIVRISVKGRKILKLI